MAESIAHPPEWCGNWHLLEGVLPNEAFRAGRARAGYIPSLQNLFLAGIENVAGVPFGLPLPLGLIREMPRGELGCSEAPIDRTVNCYAAPAAKCGPATPT